MARRIHIHEMQRGPNIANNNLCHSLITLAQRSNCKDQLKGWSKYIYLVQLSKYGNDMSNCFISLTRPRVIGWHAQKSGTYKPSTRIEA